MSISGFLTYPRQVASKQAVDQRLKHWGEFVDKFSAEQLHLESARCMDCGVPFCHHGCPLGNVIPEFNDAVHRGQWKEAYDILSSTNNFPEFTGRVCPAPCESACVLGIHQSPVSIEEIEKHIIETAFEEGFIKPEPVFQRSGKRVAVVGSGPAGLAAAAQLNRAGHLVTVFERDDQPGGLLRYGIPDFKLEKSVVERRIQLMEQEGILFRCGAEVGKNVSVSELLHGFEAIVLAGGSTIPRDLNVPGRTLEGVHFAMDFLKQQNKRVAGSTLSAAGLLATGKNVVVIGGGDTGSDCVGTSNRQGAHSVTQFELLPKPASERNIHMPWPTYPVLYKTTSSHEEGCERHFAITTKAFLGDGDGRLRAILVADLEWKTGSDGKPAAFEERPGSEREIPCELALLAMGFLHPQKEGMLEQLDIALDDRGNVFASDQQFQTNQAKIFTAGDMRRGQSLVVWAIHEGRECARQVMAFLR